MEILNLTKASRLPFKRAGSSLINTAENQFILIGGANRSEEFGDIWQLTLTQENSTYQGTWEKLEIPQSSFTPRTGQTSCLVDNQIYIFGGQNFHQNKHYNDFFQFDYTNKKLTKINNPSKQDNLEPSERNSSTLVYNYKQQQLLLFGGANEKEPLGDLFIYDLKTQLWRLQETKGCKPNSLEMHTTHFISIKNDLLDKKKKKKKNKNKTQQNAIPNSTKIVDINFGNLDIDDQDDDNNQEQLKPQQQVQQQVQKVEKEQQQQVTLHKVNIEFDEVNAIREEGNQNDQDDEEFKIDPQMQEEQLQQDKCNQQVEKEFNYMIVVGGRIKEQISNQILALNLETYEWIQYCELPVSICAHCSEIANQQLYIFGGSDGQNFLDSLFILSFENGKMYRAELSQEEQKLLQTFGKMACAMSYDKQIQKIFVFGGSHYDDESSQTLQINVQKINYQGKVKKADKLTK